MSKLVEVMAKAADACGAHDEGYDTPMGVALDALCAHIGVTPETFEMIARGDAVVVPA